MLSVVINLWGKDHKRARVCIWNLCPQRRIIRHFQSFLKRKWIIILSNCFRERPISLRYSLHTLGNGKVYECSLNLLHVFRHLIKRFKYCFQKINLTSAFIILGISWLYKNKTGKAGFYSWNFNVYTFENKFTQKVPVLNGNILKYYLFYLNLNCQRKFFLILLASIIFSSVWNDEQNLKNHLELDRTTEKLTFCFLSCCVFEQKFI